ncbi:trypsin-1-like [Macrobrachium rosenbergii]|uniref:trypsin-1-like n=1 Tax=Macrobrachium rosenbergii TaxID=79674 RepID=UPI0034D528DC
MSLSVSTTPWDKPLNPVCKWTFQGTSAQSRITFSCDSFTLRKCLGISLDIVGGSLRKSYCGIISGLYEVSSVNQMEVTLSSQARGLAPNDGFSCTVQAVSASSVGGTGNNCVTMPTSPLNTDNSCYCGRKNPITRIVGGNPSSVHEYPWQVAITKSNLYRPYCGGSIICDRWILTAAHCVYGQLAANNLVVIGEHQWTSTSDTSVTEPREIQQIIIHPDYDVQFMDNDIALIQLKTPITFPSNNKIAPVCLPSGNSLYENVDAVATGWGTLSYGGSQPSTLYEVTLPTMTNTRCSSLINGITDNMICAGVDQGGRDTCTGDSGGPLVTASSTGFMEQIGIASWGYGCGDPRKPGVYTRVTRYMTWIQNYAADCKYCVR